MLLLLASVAISAFVLPNTASQYRSVARHNRRASSPVLNIQFDVNDAVTRLNAAVEREDYAAAK